VNYIQNFIQRKSFIVLAAAILLLTSLACGTPQNPAMDFTGTVIPSTQGDAQGTGTLFIYAVTTRNERVAMSTLSADAQTAVSQYCDNGEVLSCFSAAGVLDKGRPQSVAFLPTYSNDSTAVYGVSWYDDTYTWVVVEIVDENGLLKVSSTRGWVTCEQYACDIPEALIDGTDTSNLFPPQE
jgi:hypothetical protein